MVFIEKLFQYYMPIDSFIFVKYLGVINPNDTACSISAFWVSNIA